jgi:hypothetical protein
LVSEVPVQVLHLEVLVEIRFSLVQL